MLSEAFQEFQFSDKIALNGIHNSLPSATIPALCLGVLYFGWGFWTFLFKPKLYPQEPKEIPYWIPSKYTTNPSSI